MLAPLSIPSDEGSNTWVVAHCLTRHEKKLASDLRDAGFGYFLPLVHEVKFSGAKRFEVWTPIDVLDGYVFAWAGEPAEPGFTIPRSLFEFLESHRSFINMIDVRPSARRRLVSDMVCLHAGIMSGRIANGVRLAVVGQLGRVASGPYQGLEAKIDRVTGKGYALMTVETLGQTVPIEIPLHQIEIIGGQRSVAA